MLINKRIPVNIFQTMPTSSKSLDVNVEHLKSALLKKDMPQLVKALQSEIDVNATLRIQGQRHTALNYSISQCWLAGVNTLLRAGANPDTPIEQVGSFPLNNAIRSQWVQKIAMIEALLAANANPNVKDPNGVSPLYLAARYGVRQIVLPLIEKGADLGMQNKEDKITAVEAACHYGHWKTASILLLQMVARNIPFSIKAKYWRETLQDATHHQRNQVVEILKSMQKQSTHPAKVSYHFLPKDMLTQRKVLSIEPHKNTSEASSSGTSNKLTMKETQSSSSQASKSANLSHVPNNSKARSKEVLNKPAETLPSHSKTIPTAEPHKNTNQASSSSTSNKLTVKETQSSSSQASKSANLSHVPNNAKARLKEVLSKPATEMLPSHSNTIPSASLNLPSSSNKGKAPLREQSISQLRSSFLNHLPLSKEAQMVSVTSPDNAIRTTQTLLENTQLNKEMVECGNCYEDVPKASMVYCTSEVPHSFCGSCIKRWASEEQVGQTTAEIKCFALDCKALLDCNDERVKNALGETIIKRIEDLKQINEIKAAKIEGLESCPFCPYQAIYPPIEDNAPTFACEYFACKKISCRTCQVEAKPGHLCEKKAENEVIEAMNEAAKRTCPNPACKRQTMKDGGCNKIRCKCGTQLCDVCKKDITEEGYKHFASSRDFADSPDKIRLCPLYDDSPRATAERYQNDIDAARDRAIQSLQARGITVDVKALHKIGAQQPVFASASTKSVAPQNPRRGLHIA